MDLICLHCYLALPFFDVALRHSDVRSLAIYHYGGCEAFVTSVFFLYTTAHCSKIMINV